jgi:hypothetical protein
MIGYSGGLINTVMNFWLDRAMSQAASHRYFNTGARVRPGLFYVGFVVDKVALGHVFSLSFIYIYICI